MQPDLPLEQIKYRAIKGIATLTGRTFIMQFIAFFSTFFLTVFLSPAQYGVFFITSAIINFFAYFSDIGLAAALVQKKDKLTEVELKTTFTIQQILVLTLVGIILLLTPVIQHWYKLSQESLYLLWVLSFSLILSSFKTIPSVILERKLDFQKLVIPQLLETLTFNIIAVFLAWKGFGVSSFIWAVLARGVVGLISMYLIQPWIPGIAFSITSIKSLFRYGLPYQTNSLLAMIKDDGMTALLGGILGASGIGLLGWAQKWAFAPLRFFMDQVIKVTFPAFSRMQGDMQELGSAVSKSIFYINLAVFPSIVFLVIISPLLTEIIPKYNKWQGALMALSLICINTFWASITTPLTNTLNAIGKIHITFMLMIMWTVLTWILVPALSVICGVNGAALGYALVGTSSIIAIVVIKKYVPIDLYRSTVRLFIPALLMMLILFLLRPFAPVNIIGVILLIATGAIIYASLVIAFAGTGFIKDMKVIFKR